MVQLGSHVRDFTIAFIVLIVATQILIFLGLELGSAATSIQISIASTYAAMRFVQLHKRAPTKEEKRRLVWLSFFSGFAVSCVGLGLLGVIAYIDIGDEIFRVSLEAVKSLPFLLWVFILATSSLIIILFLHLGYGFIANRYAIAMDKRRGL